MWTVIIEQKEIKSGDYIFCDHDGIVWWQRNKNEFAEFNLMSDIFRVACIENCAGDSLSENLART